MKLINLQFVFLIVIQVVTVLVFSPFINTLIKKIKALLQGRNGPPFLQGYYDLVKYFYKESVVSKHASWIFTRTPYIYFATTICASFLIPTFYDISLLDFLGGIILLIYIFGLGRFFVAIASMEPGSGFCGMASSREMMLALLIEPVMLLALFILMLMSGSTNIQTMIHYFSSHINCFFYPCYLLALLAIFVASIAEMGRVPFDNPETHYELTMIHEGLLLEYSGKELGLMFWANWIKQFLILSLLANLIFPFQISSYFLGFLFIFIKLIILCILIAFIETIFAKVRLFRVKDILVTSFVTGVIALVLLVKQNIGGFN